MEETNRSRGVYCARLPSTMKGCFTMQPQSTTSPLFGDPRTVDDNKVAKLRQLLARLIAGNGIATSGMGQFCIYCLWCVADYYAKPVHDPDCPIRQAKEVLDECGL